MDIIWYLFKRDIANIKRRSEQLYYIIVVQGRHSSCKNIFFIFCTCSDNLKCILFVNKSNLSTKVMSINRQGVICGPIILTETFSLFLCVSALTVGHLFCYTLYIKRNARYCQEKVKTDIYGIMVFVYLHFSLNILTTFSLQNRSSIEIYVTQNFEYQCAVKRPWFSC